MMWKINKIVATRCHSFKVKMHQIQFLLGLRPIPRWVSLQYSQTLLAEFKGPTSKEGGRGGEGREGKGKGGDGRDPLVLAYTP